MAWCIKGRQVDQVCPKVPVIIARVLILSLPSLVPLSRVRANVGSVICDVEEPIKVSSHFVARVVVFNINFPLTQGYPLVFHLKSYNEPCVLKKLISLVNKATGEGELSCCYCRLS